MSKLLGLTDQEKQSVSHRNFIRNPVSFFEKVWERKIWAGKDWLVVDWTGGSVRVDTVFRVDVDKTDSCGRQGEKNLRKFTEISSEFPQSSINPENDFIKIQIRTLYVVFCQKPEFIQNITDLWVDFLLQEAEKVEKTAETNGTNGSWWKKVLFLSFVYFWEKLRWNVILNRFSRWKNSALADSTCSQKYWSSKNIVLLCM